MNIHTVNGADVTAGVILYLWPYNILYPPVPSISGIEEIYEVNISVTIRIVLCEVNVICGCYTGIFDEGVWTGRIVGGSIIDLDRTADIKPRAELATAAGLEIIG
jgi:hypothetical protein